MISGFVSRLNRLERKMPVKLEVIGDINEIINNARDHVQGSNQLKMEVLIAELEQYLASGKGTTLPGCAGELNDIPLYIEPAQWREDMQEIGFDLHANPLVTKQTSFSIQDLIFHASEMPVDKGFHFIQEDLYKILSGQFDIEDRHPELFTEIDDGYDDISMNSG